VVEWWESTRDEGKGGQRDYDAWKGGRAGEPYLDCRARRHGCLEGQQGGSDHLWQHCRPDRLVASWTDTRTTTEA
jgi:hypothetical protein